MERALGLARAAPNIGATRLPVAFAEGDRGFERG